MLRVRIIRGRILLQVRILPFSGHHRHMPDVRCQPESALCLAQPADPHSPADAATCPQQVERLFVGSGRVAEALQCIHVEWSSEKGTNKSRLRLLQALAEDGGPVSTQPDRAGKLPHWKSFLSSLVVQQTAEGQLHREQRIRDRRRGLLCTRTERRPKAQSVIRNRLRMFRWLESMIQEPLPPAVAARPGFPRGSD